jgi:predicted DNA-binding transcriptional regulator AlpA
MDTPTTTLDADHPQTMLTLPEAATVAGCSPQSIRRAIRAGTLPRHYVTGKYGAQLVVARADLERWIAVRQSGTTTDPLATSPNTPQAGRSDDQWSATMAELDRLISSLDQRVRAIEARLELPRGEPEPAALAAPHQQGADDIFPLPVRPSVPAHRPDQHSRRRPWWRRRPSPLRVW